MSNRDPRSNDSNIPEIQGGLITHKIVENDGYLFYHFSFIDRNGKDYLIRFQLDENTKPQSIPNKIADGKVLIFDEQLIVQDKENKKIYSFLVGEQIPHLKLDQTITGVGLGIKKYTW